MQFELSLPPPASLGLSVVQLIIEKTGSADEKARALITQARREESLDVATRRGIVELVETIMIYKFPLLPEIYNIRDVAVLRALHEGLKVATTLTKRRRKRA